MAVMIHMDNPFMTPSNTLAIYSIYITIYTNYMTDGSEIETLRTIPLMVIAKTTMNTIRNNAILSLGDISKLWDKNRFILFIGELLIPYRICYQRNMRMVTVDTRRQL